MGEHEGRYDGSPSIHVVTSARVLCPNGTTTGPCQNCVDRMAAGIARGQAAELHRDIEAARSPKGASNGD